MNTSNFEEIYRLFQELAQTIAGKNGQRWAMDNISNYISSHPNTISDSLPFDESELLKRIQNQLSMSKTPVNATLFNNHFQQLSTCTDAHTRTSILTFLALMAQSENNANGVHSNGSTRLRFEMPSARSRNNFMQQNSLGRNLIEASEQFITPPFRGIPSSTSTQNICANQIQCPKVQKSRSMSSFQQSAALSEITPYSDYVKNQAADSQSDFVQDVIYALTGIEGKYFKKDIITGGLKLDAKVRVSAKQSAILLRLAEVAFYHEQLISFTDASTGRTPLGLLGQGLVTALKHELTKYYGMVAMLQEKHNRHSRAAHSNDRLTLLQIEMLMVEPRERLQWLTKIAEMCQEKKGGALATEIFAFKNDGNTKRKALVHDLLVAVCTPLQYMLAKWLIEGEINDPHSEFFIEVLPEVGTDRLWNDKYRVRETMLPCFISEELAHKILVTGKSINFLKDICDERTLIKGRKELKEYLESNVEDIFADVADTKLHIMINEVYLNTSKKVLDIVMGPHKLLEHLQAMRKYLLLGQGDLVGLLMEKLKPELDRPAKELYSYELSSILDAALRSTNAQYDDAEILNNLDVRLMSNFEGDTGWDIFSLQYTIQGPLLTMLEVSMPKYLQLFKHLWRLKHMEFVLSAKIWKDQKCNAKILRSMEKELNPLLHRLYLYTSQMIHFIHQIQYYILFEVVECSWTKLQEKVQKATALDDILEAHNEFLHNVKIGAFLEDSGLIHGSLENVINASIKLEPWQDRFYEACLNELNSRRQYENQIKSSESSGKYGVTSESRFERDEARKMFDLTISEAKKSLEKIGADYEFAVKQFLLLLAGLQNQPDILQFGIRLDFNEYYKNRDQRLGAPLTFEHMRMTMSSMQFRHSNVMISSVGANATPAGPGASRFLTQSCHN